MLRQSVREYFLKPRETKMKMKVPATLIALTNRSSAEGNCFFTRNMKECMCNSNISEGPGTSPIPELPLAHCQIATRWDVFKYHTTSREQ